MPAMAEGENEIHPWTAVGCCGILINHEKARGTEAVTALRNPESTTRRKRDWCKRSDATEVPARRCRQEAVLSDNRTCRRGTGIACELPLEDGWFNSQERSVFQNEPGVTIT